MARLGGRGQAGKGRFGSARLGGLGLFRRGNMCLVEAVMEGQRLFRIVTVGRGKAVMSWCDLLCLGWVR